jgi:hypothetical protein
VGSGVIWLNSRPLWAMVIPAEAGIYLETFEQLGDGIGSHFRGNDGGRK